MPAFIDAEPLPLTHPSQSSVIMRLARIDLPVPVDHARRTAAYVTYMKV